MSPHRTIASPSLVKGLSSFSFKKKRDLMEPGTPTSGDGPSKFLGSRNPSRRNSQYSNASSMVVSEACDSDYMEDEKSDQGDHFIEDGDERLP
jgi:hypothetical protein